MQHTHRDGETKTERQRERIDGRDRERENKYPNPKQKILLKKLLVYLLYVNTKSQSYLVMFRLPRSP